MTILKVGTIFVLSVYNISTHWWHKITQKWIVLLLMVSSSMLAFWPVSVISCSTIYNLLQKQCISVVALLCVYCTTNVFITYIHKIFTYIYIIILIKTPGFLNYHHKNKSMNTQNFFSRNSYYTETFILLYKYKNVSSHYIYNGNCVHG